MYYSDELYHHGIKGQRWGRRNGPPYPLSPQTHASVVRSAGRGGYTGSKSTKRRGRIGGLTEEDTKYDPKFRTKAERDEYERRSARAQKIKKGLMIGAGAAALAGAGYLAYRNRQRILSRRLKGSSQQALNGPVQSAWNRAKVVGDGSGAIVPVRSIGRAAPNYKANLGKNGRKVRSVVSPNPGSGKKFKFTTRSTNTGIVPVNTNRSLGYLAPERRSINWRRVGLAGAGAVGLGGGTAAGVSAYRRRKKKRSSRR